MTHPLIVAALAMPKTHKVVMTYADGSKRVHETRNAASAETHASFVARPMVGRDLIERETGRTVRVVSVEIMKIEG